MDYEYAVVIADEDGNGIGEFDSNGKPLKVTSMKRLESPTLIKKDKKNIINRKIFYEKTASGTNEDLNVLAAPTLETKWDDKCFADMLNESSLQANSTPIACTLKS
ncbi:MAG: hypothetical protein IJI22_00460 [Bacilli bacterium]|nr:hypothetical protein [Bacilli bacterium]